MVSFLAGLSVFIVLLIAICLYRLAKGPTVFDRIISAAVVGTKGVILVVIIGHIFGRVEMFVDIAIVYAMLNFIVAIALARFFARARETAL
jgi:multicomponent Na+:H+ antiporter subunit F